MSGPAGELFPFIYCPILFPFLLSFYSSLPSFLRSQRCEKDRRKRGGPCTSSAYLHSRFFKERMSVSSNGLSERPLPLPFPFPSLSLIHSLSTMKERLAEKEGTCYFIRGIHLFPLRIYVSMYAGSYDFPSCYLLFSPFSSLFLPFPPFSFLFLLFLSFPSLPPSSLYLFLVYIYIYPEPGAIRGRLLNHPSPFCSRVID